MESLGIDVRLIVVQIINFGILFFVLTKFLYRPILKILDERKRRIAESLTHEQKIAEERVKLDKEKENELKKAKEKGREIIEEAKTEAEKQKNTLLKKAESEAERLLGRAKEQLILEKEKLREEIKKELTDLSLVMAEKILEEKLSRQEKAELILEPLKMLLKGALPRAPLFQSLFEKRKISPSAEKIALEILTLLKKTQNLKLLPEILEKLESSFVESAEIITSASLKAEEEEKVRFTLGEVFGKNLKIKFRVNPKIVGGLVVKVGDKVFDSSLLGKAQRLRESI